VVGPDFKGREARSTAYHGRWRPRGEIEGVFASNRTVTLHTGPQGEPFFPDKGLKWLELRVETTPRKE
jgi:hypothetical protein